MGDQPDLRFGLRRVTSQGFLVATLGQQIQFAMIERDDAKCRQCRDTFHLLGSTHRVVEYLEQEGESDAACQAHKQRNRDVPPTSWRTSAQKKRRDDWKRADDPPGAVDCPGPSPGRTHGNIYVSHRLPHPLPIIRWLLTAIELMKKNEYDILICDLHMPGIGGRDLIEWTRLNRQNMRVLLLSGDVARTDVNEFARAYGVHFLTKPFSVSELTKAVQRLSS